MIDPPSSGGRQVNDTLVFHGDGLCPHCGSLSQVEWYKSDSSWECKCCNYVLDLANTIKMCTIYKPEKNPHSVRETLSHIRTAYGLDPALPASRGPRRRSFFHPIEFAKNFAVGLVVEAVWRRMRR